MNAQHSASINAEQNFTRFQVFARLPKHDFAKGLNGKGCKQTEWLSRVKALSQRAWSGKGAPAFSLPKKRKHNQSQYLGFTCRKRPQSAHAL